MEKLEENLVLDKKRSRMSSLTDQLIVEQKFALQCERSDSFDRPHLLSLSRYLSQAQTLLAELHTLETIPVGGGIDGS